jgi:hypothetical protein
MDMNLPVTLTLAAIVAAMFVFAFIKAKQPAEPLKVRMVNYQVVQIVCVILFLILVAHLITLVAGAPMTGRRGTAAP